MAKRRHIKIGDAIRKIRKTVKGKKTKFTELKLGQTKKKNNFAA